MQGAKELLKSQGILHDTHGNLSVRSGDLVAIKPSGMALEDVHGYDVCVLNLDGSIDPGYLRPSVDTENHLSIYRKRTDVEAIVHTHSPYATAWSTRGVLPCYFTEQCDYFGWRVPCTTMIEFDWGTEVAAHMIMKDWAFLLKHHGAVTMGTNAVDAVKKAVALESICMKAILATSGGHDPEEISYENSKLWNERYRNFYGQK